MSVERKYEIRRAEYNPKIDPGRLENVPDILKASPLQGFIKQIQEKQKQVDQYVDDYVTECIIELGIDPDALKATAELNARLQRELRTARAMAVRKPEWISVDERLPDNCRAVLVALEGLTIAGAPARVIGSYSGGFWMVADADGTHYLTKYMRYKVTHWMPLPEPPKGDYDGKK